MAAWAKQWLINSNPLKTEALLFTLKLYEHLPNIEIDGIPVSFVSDHTHLGLTLSNNGRWNKHIENIVNSASKIIGIMRKLKYTFHRVVLNQIYVTYVLPVLEYSAIVWDNCTAQNSNTLEKLQNEAARIVTGLTRFVSLDNLYRECGWVPLSVRRQEQKLSFMYKAVNGLPPDYIRDIIPPYVRETTSYLLRNNNNLVTPTTRTEISRKLCIPFSVSLWNSLDNDIRTADSLSSFKRSIKTQRPNKSKVPPYFLSGGRYLSVQHAQIRNNCSNLKSDLYEKHLCPSPMCSCNTAVEDAAHYFFHCPSFAESRIVLFQATQAFHPSNMDKLLFGDASISDQQNSVLFSAV